MAFNSSAFNTTALNGGVIGAALETGAISLTLSQEVADTAAITLGITQVVYTPIWLPSDPAWDLVYSFNNSDVTGQTITDLTGNGYDGVLGTAEIVNEYCYFERFGSDVIADASYSPTNSVGSFSFMFRHEGVNDQTRLNIFRRDIFSSFAKNNLAIEYTSNGIRVQFDEFNIDGAPTYPDNVRVTGALTAGQWYHIHVESDGVVWTGYVDGVAQTPVVVNGVNSGRWFSSLKPNGYLSPTAGVLTFANILGGNQAGDNFDSFFSVDDFRISNRTLTAQEISDLSAINIPMPVDDVFAGDSADYNHPDCLAAYDFDLVGYAEGSFTDVTLQGHDTEPRLVTLEAGKYQEAVDFDGTNLVKLPESLVSDLLDYNRGALSLWVKPKTPTGFSSGKIFAITGTYIDEFGESKFNQLQISLSAKRLVISYLDPLINVSKQTTAQLTVDVYTHVVITADGADWKVYFDNVEQTLQLLSPIFSYRWIGWLQGDIVASLGGIASPNGVEGASTFLALDQAYLFKRPRSVQDVDDLYTVVPDFVPAIGTISRVLSQSVSAIETGVITLGITQTVNERQLGTLTLSFEQSVIATGAIVARLNQRVADPFVPTDAVQWEAIVTVDGLAQTALVGVVTVSGGEGEQILASFQAKPPTGVVTVTSLVAKPVTIDYADQTRFSRLFTGIIDEVEYDATDSILTFLCITNRKGLINAKSRDQLASEIGGYWSKFVFDKDADPFEYAGDRVSTVMAAYESNPYNQFALVPFAAKVTPDVVYDEGDILDGTVVPTFVSRDQLVNNWTLNFDYRYDRLRHRERSYTWDMLTRNLIDGVYSGFDSWEGYLRDPVTLMPRDAVETAIESNEWIIKGTPVYTDLPPSGYYGGIGWTPKQTTIITDEQGRTIRTVKDISAVYATAANFTLARRFAQQISEAYAIKLTAPQSVAQYGSIDETSSRGIRVEFDVSGWEEFTAYNPPSGALSANGDYVIDKDDNRLEGGRSSFNEAVLASQSIIKREILDSHRQNYAEFDVFLDPLIDLTKTVHVDTARVQAKGKVYEFEHVMIIDGGDPTATTSVKLAISKATGAQADGPVAVPTPPAVTDATFIPQPKALGNHFGNHFASPAYQNWWSGCITNYKFQDFNSANLNRYPAKFTVDGEKIGDEDRKERKITALSTVNIEIPDELLTITAP